MTHAIYMAMFPQPVTRDDRQTFVRILENNFDSKFDSCQFIDECLFIRVDDSIDAASIKKLFDKSFSTNTMVIRQSTDSAGLPGSLTISVFRKQNPDSQHPATQKREEPLRTRETSVRAAGCEIVIMNQYLRVPHS